MHLHWLSPTHVSLVRTIFLTSSISCITAMKPTWLRVGSSGVDVAIYLCWFKKVSGFQLQEMPIANQSCGWDFWTQKHTGRYQFNQFEIKCALFDTASLGPFWFVLKITMCAASIRTSTIFPIRGTQSSLKTHVKSIQNPSIKEDHPPSTSSLCSRVVSV